MKKKFRSKNHTGAGRILIHGLSVCSVLVAIGCVYLTLSPLTQDLLSTLSRASVSLYLPQSSSQSLTEKEIPSPSVSDPQGEVFPSSTPSPSPENTPLPLTTPDPNRETQAIRETQILGGTTNGFRILDRSGTEGIDYQAQADAFDAEIPRDGTPVILIYHTHTTESYQTTGNDWCYGDESMRSMDPDETVVAVGEEIAGVLRRAGYGVIHDTTIHDSPAYTGSYDRSAQTIRKNLEAYPTLCLTLDVHRDSLTDSDGNLLKTVTEINGQKAAQFMIICGCGADPSLQFPDWQKNLQFGLSLQQKADEIYPGLSRPLYFLERVYNENFTPCSLLVEFGTSGNTIEEARLTGRLFAEILIDILNEA